jgi:hypothetical protein
MQIELAEGGQKRVGVGDPEGAARTVVDLELVAQGQFARQFALEDPRGVDLGQLHRLALGGVDGDRLGRGPQRADDHPAVLGARVGAENRVGLGVVAVREQVELCGGDGRCGHESSSRRATPATGIGSQSGRLSRS